MAANSPSTDQNQSEYRPSVTDDDFIEETKLFHQMFDQAKINQSENEGFVYLLSTSWIGNWKLKVSYAELESGKELKPSHINL